MDIATALLDLISLQDDITHLNEAGPATNELRRKQNQRDQLRAKIRQGWEAMQAEITALRREQLDLLKQQEISITEARMRDGLIQENQRLHAQLSIAYGELARYGSDRDTAIAQASLLRIHLDWALDHVEESAWEERSRPGEFAIHLAAANAALAKEEQYEQH